MRACFQRVAVKKNCLVTVPLPHGKIRRTTSYFQNSKSGSDSAETNLGETFPTFTTDSSPSTSQPQASDISSTAAIGSTSQSISTNASPTNQIPVAHDKLDAGNHIATKFTVADGLKTELHQKP